jgi:nitrate/nitrite transporter NarK
MIRERSGPSEAIAAREEAASLRILLWTFALAAIAMCLTVVVTLSRTWTEMLWVSAFVLVFALLKIALANALFYVMINYDKDARPVPVRNTAILQPPRRVAGGTRRLTGALSLAAATKSPRPNPPRGKYNPES